MLVPRRQKYLLKNSSMLGCIFLMEVSRVHEMYFRGKLQLVSDFQSHQTSIGHDEGELEVWMWDRVPRLEYFRTLKKNFFSFWLSFLKLGHTFVFHTQKRNFCLWRWRLRFFSPVHIPSVYGINRVGRTQSQIYDSTGALIGISPMYIWCQGKRESSGNRSSL